MEIKAGDRFKYVSKFGWFIWEVQSDLRGKIIHHSDGSIPDDTVSHRWGISANDEYLGNFGKDSNFNELYNLFNGK